MATQPEEFPRWGLLDENDPVTGAPNKVQPTTEFQNSGLKRDEPLYRANLNWMFDNIDQWIEYLNTVSSTLTVDQTIFVSTTGDDSTGDGTLLLPFATPHKAIASLNGAAIAPDTTITISCDTGIYTFTEPLIINHPYGERIQIVGQQLLNNMISGTVEADWSLDRLVPIVPARATPQLHNSAGTLSAAADNATRVLGMQSDLLNNIALGESVFRTVFKFQNSSGISIRGNTSLGLFNRIMVQGDWTGNEAELEAFHGIETGEGTGLGLDSPDSVSGGTIFLGNQVMFIAFRGNGISAKYGGNIMCSDGVVSCNNLSSGFHAAFSGVIAANLSTTQGNVISGYFSENASSIRAEGGITSGNLGTGVVSTASSSINAETIKSLGNGGSGFEVGLSSDCTINNAQGRGNFAAGISIARSSSASIDSTTFSDNNGDGIVNKGGNFEADTVSSENNGGVGVFLNNTAGATISSLTVQDNDGDEILVSLGSSLSISTPTIATGSTVTAEKNSYISIPMLSGITYTPSYGVVDPMVGLINT